MSRTSAKLKTGGEGIAQRASLVCGLQHHHFLDHLNPGRGRLRRAQGIGYARAHIRIDVARPISAQTRKLRRRERASVFCAGTTRWLLPYKGTREPILPKAHAQGPPTGAPGSASRCAIQSPSCALSASGRCSSDAAVRTISSSPSASVPFGFPAGFGPTSAIFR
jgi:hypothetical protein